MPLTSIAVQTDGEVVVASDGSSRWRPDSGQVLLDFEASEIAERADQTARFTPRLIEPPAGAGAAPNIEQESDAAWVGRFRGVERPEASREDDPALTAEEWHEAGCELEGSSAEQARDAYRRALDLDPHLADAHVNLGRLLHIAGELGCAEPHYREAVSLDPDDPTPHFNLGVLLEELKRRDEAVHAYRQAILRDPDFADAHCNLGLLLESLGRRQEAMRHLMAARKLSGSTG
jgi:tetratricopeptide (TPR) repeat protein